MLAAQIIDRDIVKDLKEPTDEAPLLVVGRETLECTGERFLREVFRQRTIADHAGRKIYGWRRIAAYEIAVRRLGSGKRLLHQFSIGG